MPYCLDATEPVDLGVRRIASEQIERALDELSRDKLGPHEKAFAVRKRCKKVRGLIRLVRPAFAGYAEENAAFRDAARGLAGLRDATAMLDTFDELVSSDINPARFAPIRSELVRRSKEAAKADVQEALDAFQHAMEQALERSRHWEIKKEGFEVVRAGLGKTYARAQIDMQTAYDMRSAEAFHEWRKQIKYDRYHTRLLRDAWELAADDRYELAKSVSDLLGSDHDLSELGAFLGSQEVELSTEICRRQTDVRLRAHELGKQLYSDSAKEHTRRVERLWTHWYACESA